MPDENQQLEDFRDCLGLLGRMQLNQNLYRKVGMPGVVPITLLEAHQQDWTEFAEQVRLQELLGDSGNHSR